MAVWQNSQNYAPRCRRQLSALLLSALRNSALSCRADKDSYPHDGRADKDSYPHDGRADKDSYPHDHNQYIRLSS